MHKMYKAVAALALVLVPSIAEAQRMPHSPVPWAKGYQTIEFCRERCYTYCDNRYEYSVRPICYADCDRKYKPCKK